MLAGILWHLEMCSVGQEMHREQLPCTLPTQHPKSGPVLNVQSYLSHSQVMELGREQNGLVLAMKILMSQTFHFLFLSKEKGFEALRRVTGPAVIKKTA